MWNDTPGWLASSSFVEPVPVPGVEPDSSPVVCCQFSAAWLPYVLGALQQLTQPPAWNAAPDVVAATLEQATRLISLVAVGTDCVSALEFRCDPIGGQPQYSTDSGTTWHDLPNCFIGPTGPAGPTGATGATGATGPPGPASIWRLHNCDLQYSNDAGATWTTASGYSTAAIAACLQGSPGNPQGVSVPTQACNIAGYLTYDVLKEALQHTYDQVQAANSLVNTVAGFIPLIAGINLVLGLMTAAGVAIYNVVQGGTAGDFSGALGNAGLWSAINCAIYAAIKADGAVTAANYAAMRAGVNGVAWPHADVQNAVLGFLDGMGAQGILAIQNVGAAYIGDCSACGTWCYEWDLTAALGPWQIVPGRGTWTSGVGVTSQVVSATDQALIFISISPTVIDGGGIEFTAVNGAGTAARQLQYYRSGVSVLVANIDSAAHATPFDTALYTAAHSADEVDYVMGSQTGAGGIVIRKVQLRGTGPNPFGTDNCTFN